MSVAGWSWEPDRLKTDLEGRGYDVDTADARLAGGGGSLVARRDHGPRSHVVAVDAGGRVRAKVTVSLREARRSADVAGVPLRVVTETRQGVTITGTLQGEQQFADLLDHLDEIATPAPVQGTASADDPSTA